jgi:hypothetical protein
LNSPNPAYALSDPRAWIGRPAKFREVHHAPPIEQVRYFELSQQPAPPALVAVQRDQFEASGLSELRAPWVARLRTAETACRDFDRKLQIAKKNYASEPSRETRVDRDTALALLDGAQTDLEIVQDQVRAANAEHAKINWDRRYQAYLDGIAAKQQYADKLDAAADAAERFAAIVADLGVMRLGELDGRRRVRDQLVRGFQRHGLGYEDLKELIRL